MSVTIQKWRPGYRVIPNPASFDTRIILQNNETQGNCGRNTPIFIFIFFVTSFLSSLFLSDFISPVFLTNPLFKKYLPFDTNILEAK